MSYQQLPNIPAIDLNTVSGGMLKEPPAGSKPPPKPESFHDRFVGWVRTYQQYN